MADVENDKVPENPYRVLEVVEVENTALNNVVEADVIMEPKFEAIVDMEYFTGIKRFNNVIDRLGVDIDLQKRYEVFDRIYEEGMRGKKFERNRNNR